MIDREEDGGHIWMTPETPVILYALGELKYGGTPLSDERIQVCSLF